MSMIVTFLDYKEFEKLRSLHADSCRYFHAGFGLGRNVTHVMKVEDEIYLELSPIADETYSGVSQEVKSKEVEKEIEALIG